MSTRRIVAPTFRYEGGKALLSPTIVKFIPKRGRKFIDLFAGRGNITFCAIAEGLAFDEWILNDINRAPFFRALRDHGDSFKVTAKTKEEFDRLKGLVQQGDPHALLMEPFVCFNGGTFSGSGFTTGGGCSPETHENNVRLANEFLRANNVRITELDWLDCLEAEQPGEHDFVMVDGPYIDSEVGSYESAAICPTEVIEYLQGARFNWVFTEHRQPLYTEAFGEPVYQQQARRSSPNSIQSADEFECIWTNIGESGTKRDSVTLPPLPVPDDRKDTYYVGLDNEALLREIKECAAVITESRNQMNKEMRRRLLPALLELKKRTHRKTPGYYETLIAMGLNPATVRQWFYRSYTADEIIDLIEEKQPEPAPKPSDDDNPLAEDSIDSDAHLLKHADKMARAILDNKVAYAKRLATEYVRVREESRE